MTHEQENEHKEKTMNQAITDPTTREEIEAVLISKIENDEAATGLYDTGLYFVSVDRVFDGKGSSEPVFQWFDDVLNG